MSTGQVTVLLVYALFTMVMRDVSTLSAGTRYIQRQNYGYTLESSGQASLTSGYVRLIFHYTFPHQPIQNTSRKFNFQTHPRNIATALRDPRARQRCNHFKSVVENIYVMKDDIFNHVSGRLSEISFMLTNFPGTSTRQHRSLFTWIGTGIADVFGLSTHKDLKRVQNMLVKVLNGTQRLMSLGNQDRI